MQRMARSRSVMMPTASGTLLGSTTTSVPTSFSAMRCAATRMLSLDEAVTTTRLHILPTDISASLLARIPEKGVRSFVDKYVFHHDDELNHRIMPDLVGVEGLSLTSDFTPNPLDPPPGLLSS